MKHLRMIKIKSEWEMGLVTAMAEMVKCWQGFPAARHLPVFWGHWEGWWVGALSLVVSLSPHLLGTTRSTWHSQVPVLFIS